MTQHLQLDDVTVRRGRVTTLSGITAKIDAGQICALIGPNGAGKSTLLAAIAGQVPANGRLHFQGRAIDPRRIGYMPQHIEVQAELSVLEVMLLGRHDALGWQVKASVIDEASALLCRIGLGDLAERGMHTLSGGQQQLVLLAQRLMRKPDLLLLDEATSALDIRHQMQVLAMLRAYVAATGALVLFAMHDLNLAAHHSDSILLLKNGRLVEHGSFATAVTEKSLRSVYGIEAEFLYTGSGRSVVVPLSLNPMAFSEIAS